VKNLKQLFIVVVLTTLSYSYAYAQSAQETTSMPPNDSIEVSLLTCGPGQEVWALYGHTALRFNNLTTGQDLAINYGMFSFEQKNFVLRFIFGLTDYEMGIAPFQPFLEEYLAEGRWVREQRLNLTKEEKFRLAAAIAENYQPQNRTYRYNYFYDNCTTRARDIVVRQLSGQVHYADKLQAPVSYRELVHQCLTAHPWSRLGIDLLLGYEADRPITAEQQQFLPDSLSHDFARATIADKDGLTRPLVLNEKADMPAATLSTTTSALSVRPWMCALALACLILIVTVCQWRCKIFDAILLLIIGLAGLILLAMVFSQHPTVDRNLQILLLNPLALLFLYPAVWRKNRTTWAILALCLVVFLFGNLVQRYAEGANILALSLLIRYIYNWKRANKQPQTRLKRKK